MIPFISTIRKQLIVSLLVFVPSITLAQPQGQTYPPRSAEVEVFVASRCDDCLRTIGFLDALQIPYRIYNLEQDRRAEQEYLSSIGRGIIPAIRKGGLLIRGYRPRELRRLVATGNGVDTNNSPKPKEQSNQQRKQHGAITPQEAPTATLPPAKSTEDNSPPKKDNDSNVDPENQFDVSSTLDESAEQN